MLRKTFLFALVILVALSSCTSVRKTIESGNYDKAIDLAVGKLKGKKNKKEDYIKGLELALEKANARDLANVNYFLAENNPKNWERINGLYLNIQHRQNKILPLLPLVAKNGYEANLKFENVASLERDSRQKAAAFAFQNANTLLQRAETMNDRVAARDAYHELKKIKQFDIAIDGVDNAMDKAKELGTTHILVDVKNHSNAILPRDFYQRIANMSKYDLASAWLEYDFAENTAKKYDYSVVIRLNMIDISPEMMNTRDYIDEARVEDGWDYILDNKGNVKKDSLGNDMKQKRYVNVRAYVREVYQSKAAKIGGDLEIYDFRSGALLDRERLGTEVVFQHYASTFNGDRRALSPESCRRIGNSPMPFPQNSDMLADAADRLKPMLRNRLRDSRMII